MRALRFDGVAHCDLRYDVADRQVKLLEVNARFWGSLIGSQVAGVNFPALAIRMAMNLGIPHTDFRYCRYHSSAVVLKNVFKFPRRLPDLPKLLINSDLWFRLRDPVPELTTVFRRLRGKG